MNTPDGPQKSAAEAIKDLEAEGLTPEQIEAELERARSLEPPKEQRSEGDGENMPLEGEQALSDWRGLLRKRGVDSPTCPTCGADAWGGIGDVGILILEGRNPATGEIKRIAGSVHALVAVCGKCGFMSLYDREVIGE
jgi:hypothetical protein